MEPSAGILSLPFAAHNTSNVGVQMRSAATDGRFWIEPSVDEIEALMGRLGGDTDLELIRHDIAALIVRMIESRQNQLTYWEKVHFEMAIALLPTIWLRLCVAHLKMATEPPLDEPRFFANLERIGHFEALSAADLI